MPRADPSPAVPVPERPRWIPPPQPIPSAPLPQEQMPGGPIQPIPNANPPSQTWDQRRMYDRWNAPKGQPVSQESSDPPGTAWLKTARQKFNPEDAFTPQQNLDRNKPWSKPGPYQTQLSPDEETNFIIWMREKNQDYWDDAFGPNQDTPVYDWRGYWKAMTAGDERAHGTFNQSDQRTHYPDVWKTPYHSTFSNESIYAQPSAPVWRNDKYMTPGGQVIYDPDAGRWYGLPK